MISDMQQRLNNFAVIVVVFPVAWSNTSKERRRGTDRFPIRFAVQTGEAGRREIDYTLCVAPWNLPGRRGIIHHVWLLGICLGFPLHLLGQKGSDPAVKKQCRGKDLGVWGLGVKRRGFFSQGLCVVICGFEAGVIATSWALASVFNFWLQTTLSKARLQAAFFLLGKLRQSLWGWCALVEPLLLPKTSAVGKFCSEDRETQMALHPEALWRGREKT